MWPQLKKHWLLHAGCRAGAAVPGQCWLGSGSHRLDQVAAFLETGFWLLGLIRRGNAPSPSPGSWENILTLKKSWDMLTAEKKQSSPGLVAAATSPAGTRITNSRVQRPRNQMVCAPETVWGKSQRTHHLLWLWGNLSFHSVPQNPVSTLDG